MILDAIMDNDMSSVKHFLSEDIYLKYEELIDAYYDTSRAQGIVALCELVVIVAYYIVYQIYNDGQTIGKKMMKLKVVSRKDELTMNQMIFRTCLSTPMVINLFSLFIIIFRNVQIKRPFKFQFGTGQKNWHLLLLFFLYNR